MQLLEQHNRLRRLFKQTPRLGGHQAGDDRAVAIYDLFTVHSRLEEELVYPVLRRLDPALADKAEAEHREADQVVADVRDRDYANNTEVQDDLDKLWRLFHVHAQWEEDEVIPKLSSLDKAEADQLGKALYERNQELLREFPEALDTSAETEGFVASPRI
ncbi:MAG: hemerythrin domain-containing protein [Acidimicrobiales bacterium]